MNKNILFRVLVSLIIFINIYYVFIESNIHSYFYSITLASLLYFVSAVLLLKIEIKPNELFLIIGLIFILKVSAFSVVPTGSDDYFRYLWDGKVLANGINPFQFAPNSPELEQFQSDLLPGMVTYPHIKTIYFPLSQLSFVFAYSIAGESAVGLKVILLLADILLTLGFYVILKKENFDVKLLLLYTLCPLIFYQFFVDAHIDLLGIMFFLFALMFYKDKKIVAALLLGASLAVKPTFIFTIPIFFFYEKSSKNKMIWFSLPLLFLAATFLPFSFSANPLDTLLNFSQHWTFNGAVYNLLTLFTSNNYTIRIILLILLIVSYLLILGYNRSIVSSIYYSLILLFLFSPIVHPWYVTWLIVPLIFCFNYSGIAYMTTVSFAFYTTLVFQSDGVWKDNIFILLLEYTPVIFLLFYELSQSNFMKTKAIARYFNKT